VAFGISLLGVIIINQIIKYIAFYDTHNNSDEKRSFSPAATAKIDYICSVLNNAKFRVIIVSPARTGKNQCFKGKQIELRKGVDLKLFPTLPWGNNLQKFLSLVFGDFMLLMYCLFNIRKNETIIVYHSLGLRQVVNFAKMLKKFKVILEVEEIYQDVVKCSNRVKQSEYKVLKDADKYIFSTELLNQKINIDNKPYTVNHGTYEVEEDRKETFDDKKIHVVYAGTFEAKKGGAAAAAATAAFLPEKYHLHIIGFGSKQQVEDIKKIVATVSENSKATITYDGLLRGEEYIRFLQKCHIGLSTQDPEADFNNSSFPSKILSYMTNGLRVVTVRIRAIESSAVNDVVYYYEKQDPYEIAKAIMSINFNDDYDSRRIVIEMDNRFRNDIKKLLS